MEDVFSGLDALERDYLVGRMAEELPEIREKPGLLFSVLSAGIIHAKAETDKRYP